MKSKLLIRIAAGCVLFFAVGHTAGHLTRKSPTQEAERQVLKTMEEKKFDFNGAFRSYDDFYEGMSLNLIFTLLALTVMLWFISGITDKEIAKKLLWPIFFLLVGFAITSFLFFFLVPAITCVVASALILWSLVGINKKI